MSSKKRHKPSQPIPAHPATTKLPIQRLRRLDEIVTVVQVIGLATAFFASDQVRGAVAIGCIVVFFAGSGLFSWAFLIAASRSRQEEVSVAGAFFLGDGSTSTEHRRWAYGLLAAQTVIGLVAASADPYTAMAFGILVPMFGLGVVAFLGSAHGMFRVRKPTK